MKMDLPKCILACLCGANNAQPTPNQPRNRHYVLVDEKPFLQPLPSISRTTKCASTNDDLDQLTHRILTILVTSPAPFPGTNLTASIATQTGITAQDWTSYLAERVLHALEDTLKGDHATWGEAIADAYTHAIEFAKEELRELWEYAKEHPYEVAATVLLTVLALGVLARLVPVLVRVLGFGELGPVEGSFAAWWQRLYGGYVPKGSLWSFLQRMGMTW
ncbi:hypothetical protein VTI74DRAFT_10413 [Chaetomium olivicolor]